jgi:branched-chain amino acid transport system ATP-binding protein
MSSPVLAVEALEAGYEPGAAIIRGISLTVESGEIVSILGPYGAGKSTLIKAIAGLVPKFRGKVILEGRDITATKAHELVRSGLAYVPQTDNVFALMSVDDNLRLASDILAKPDRQGQMEAMYGFFPDLARQRRLESGRLSGGQRQMLAIARALIARPHILTSSFWTRPRPGCRPSFQAGSSPSSQRSGTEALRSSWSSRMPERRLPLATVRSF